MEHRVLVDDIKKDWDKFLEVHTGDYYGGSDVANISGLGWDSPLAVWLRKTGKTSPVKQNDQMAYGKHLEPFVRGLLAERVGKLISEVNQIWQHPEHDWMIGSPDCLVGENELAELKTHKIYADDYWDEDRASDSALCQLQWYLGVSDMDGGYCAALIGGDCDKFYSPHFEKDQVLIDQMIERVEAFRELVKADTPPDAGPGDAKLIREFLCPEVEKEKEIDLTERHTDTIRRYKDLTDERKEAKKGVSVLESEINSIKNQLLCDCQGAGTILIGDDRVKLSKVVVKPYENKGSEYFRVSVKWGK